MRDHYWKDLKRKAGWFLSNNDFEWKKKCQKIEETPKYWYFRREEVLNFQSCAGLLGIMDATHFSTSISLSFWRKNVENEELNQLFFLYNISSSFWGCLNKCENPPWTVSCDYTENSPPKKMFLKSFVKVQVISGYYVTKFRARKIVRSRYSLDTH